MSGEDDPSEVEFYSGGHALSLLYENTQDPVMGMSGGLIIWRVQQFEVGNQRFQ